MTSRDRILLASSVAVIAAVGIWGIVDPDAMVVTASAMVSELFRSRGWFIMLTVTGLLVFCLALAFSRYGDIRLGTEDERPEFSTVSWLSMLFAAGMGVGLLFWATAEPLTHFRIIKTVMDEPAAADAALFVTNFHWGIHAWAIYGATALAIAYFSFRRGTPMLVSAPFIELFGAERWARLLGWVSDFLAIVAIAIGVAGSIAMGVFQVADGIDLMAGGDGAGPLLILAVFLIMIGCCIPPLLVDLGRGMALLSDAAMAIAAFLIVYLLLVGPTSFLMSSILEGIGSYLGEVFVHGFRTFAFFGDEAGTWFQDWTLTYMVWWLAWGPFVGVFIARISRGRTIREFVFGVLLGPTVFSVFWFGAFGGVGFFDSLYRGGALEALTVSQVERVTFALLALLPGSTLTMAATILAAFLFIVTSVVSAAFVLGMFSSAGSPDPSKRVKLIWGLLLGLLGYAMILSGSVEAVKKVIALGAMPFVFITILLLVCLVRALGQEAHHAHR